jgi:hypothetical protein
MNRSFLLTLASALLVFAVGSGIGRAPSETFDTMPLARDADGRPLRMLPTVVVSAHAPHAQVAASSAETPSVMLDGAVSQARTAIADGVGYGVRRAGLAIPYYAFGRNARNSE